MAPPIATAKCIILHFSDISIIPGRTLSCFVVKLTKSRSATQNSSIIELSSMFVNSFYPFSSYLSPLKKRVSMQQEHIFPSFALFGTLPIFIFGFFRIFMHYIVKFQHKFKNNPHFMHPCIHSILIQFCNRPLEKDKSCPIYHRTGFVRFLFYCSRCPFRTMVSTT